MNDQLPPETTNQPYDVFLSHNSKDKPAVETLAVRLADEARIKVWLDKWNLIPGEPWQEGLEDALNQSRTCAVFIGPSGLSPWNHEEMRNALQRRVQQAGFRVIPVLLPGATMPERGLLPSFLSRLTWVDFRADKGLQDDEAFHRLVCGIEGIEPGRGQIATTPIIECPYRGLEVFDEEHARFFFGREAMTQHLVEALRPTRFLCVLGPSGSGKSSLARAGLLPQLRAGKSPGSQRWQYVVFKPGAHPIEELALNLVELQKGQHQIGNAKQLIKDFNDGETALHLFARLLLKSHPLDARLLLLVDQFEEVFTLCQDPAERAQFIKNLRDAGTIDGGRTVIVPTMRADFLSRAAESPDLAELLSTHQFIVSPMRPDELRRAIEEPARLSGLRFDPGLVERILNDVGHEPGALPLLEHALRELFEKRSSENVMTAQAYEQSGGVQGALAQKAEAIYAQFSPEQQIILRRVMLRLTQPGEGTAEMRRRATLQEFWRDDEERATVAKILYTLADERLLTISRDASGEEPVDVAHEALTRGWPRLKRWIKDDPEGLRLRHRITEDARDWLRQSRSKDYLYGGTRLSQAIKWRQTNPEYLSQSEFAFLEASQQEHIHKQKREKRRIQNIVIFILCLEGIVFVVSVLSLVNLLALERAVLDELRATAIILRDTIETNYEAAKPLDSQRSISRLQTAAITNQAILFNESGIAVLGQGTPDDRNKKNLEEVRQVITTGVAIRRVRQIGGKGFISFLVPVSDGKNRVGALEVYSSTSLPRRSILMLPFLISAFIALVPVVLVIIIMKKRRSSAKSTPSNK